MKRLLDATGLAKGGESSSAAKLGRLEDLSIVSAAYEIGGQLFGSIGVVGLARMAYDRMIQTVDITAKLVSNGHSH